MGFNMLQWSQSPRELERFHSQLSKTDKLHTTDDHLNLPLAAEGVPPPGLEYFEIPPIAHRPQQLVIPFVHIYPSGDLDQGAPIFYGVTSRANVLDQRAIPEERRSGQVHVYAEDTALHSCVFDLTSRSRAELFAARLMPVFFRQAYVADRIAHLQALQASIEDQQFTGSPWRAAEPLSIGIRALEAFGATLSD